METSEKGRVVCCIHSLAGGGAERLMAGLANRLTANWEVALLTLEHARLDRYEVAPEVQRVGLGLTRHSRNRALGLIANVRRVREVRQAIRELAPDVVLSFCDQMNIVVLAATRRLRLPTVVTEFTDPRHQQMPQPWPWLRRKFYPSAMLGVALNCSTYPIVRQWVRGPVAIISAAVDPPPADFSQRGGADGRKVLVGLGRLSPEKGFDRLIAAFSEVANEFPEWDLKIAGDGADAEKLRGMVAERQLDRRIHFVGWLKNVWDFLAGADAFALTSRYDGYPVALLEAMVAGVPVLSVDCDSGPREMIDHDRTGLLVGNDHASLVAGMRRLLGDADLRRRLADSSKEIQDQLSWDRFVNDYSLVLKRAIVRDRSSTGLPGLERLTRVTPGAPRSASEARPVPPV